MYLISRAPRKMSKSPKKYDSVLTQPAPLKNAPAKRAITGIFAPQGMNVASIEVVLLSLSSLIVRQAMMAGMPQPVPMTTGMTDLPERPTLLKIGSMTALTRAM